MDISKKISNKSFTFFVIFFAFIKFILVNQIPILAKGEMIHDDRLMVNMSITLLEGNWLGNYNHMTLIKGIGYPIFLVISKLTGVPYLTLLTLFYITSVLLMIFILSKIIKSKIWLGIIYIALLFNPVTMALDTFQRIYRNGLLPGQIILVICCFFAVYLYRNEKIVKRIIWDFMAGFSLVFLWITREDGIWILPFVFVATIITLTSSIFERKKNEKKNLIIKSLLTLVPLIIFIINIGIISFINYKVYGEFITNELNSGNFPRMIKTIYSVKPNEDIEYVSVPRDTMNRIYEVSPTLFSIKDEVEKSLDRWEVNGKIVGDNEVEDGWFFWSIRDAVYNAGYYRNAASASIFYDAVTEEIEEAFSDKILEKRSTMPSALMSPWKKVYSEKLIKACIDAVKYIVTYRDVAASAIVKDNNTAEDTKLFELLTNNNSSSAINKITVKGWAFSKNTDEHINASVIDDKGNILGNVNFSGGDDVYNYFLANNKSDYQNAINSRFSIEVQYNKDVSSNLFLLINDDQDDNMIISLDGGEIINKIESIEYCIDAVIKNEANVFDDLRNNKVNHINRIIEIYRKLTPTITATAFICYLFITIIGINSWKKRKIFYRDEWLLLSGILGSFIVLILGVSYTDISAYSAINYMYLAASYSLLILFNSIALAIGLPMLYKGLKHFI